jgi:hypothetical protein
MTDVLAVTAAAWGLLMALAPVLQIRRMLETRSSADVSLTWLAVLIISLGNFALIVPNSVALAVGLVTVGIAWQYRGGRAATGVTQR